jgi:type II secretory ATPase GspE/PulE/Tfp pilus assembly ATPase PilB-like protein
VVALSDVPDAQTAKEVLKADQEKCRVWCSIQADGAVGAIQQWMKLVGDAEATANSVRGVIAEKLIRKLCINCKQAYQPAPDVLKKLGLPADKVKQLFKKGGEVLVKNKPETCPVCQGTGYLQRDGAFEVFEITDGAREMIKAQNWAGVKAELRKSGLPSIQQAALRKAVDGVTSVEEVLRITAEAAPAKPAAPKPAAKPTA